MQIPFEAFCIFYAPDRTAICQSGRSKAHPRESIPVTVIEVLPKDKKGKDQTSTPLGQVTVDLLPILRGESRLNLLVDLHPVPGSPIDTADAPRVEMEITVQVRRTRGSLVGSEEGQSED